MAQVSPLWFIPVVVTWLAFMVTGMRANMAWLEIHRQVGSKELGTWYRNRRGWHQKVVEQFRERIEHETDPARRDSMNELLRTWRTLYRRCQVLFVTFIGVGAAVFITIVVLSAA